MVQVQWVQMQSSGGTTLRRWHAHLVQPFVSREFALLRFHDGWWHLELLLADMPLRGVARYPRHEHAMRQVERWIASRWQRTVPADGGDPRGMLAGPGRVVLAMRRLRR